MALNNLGEILVQQGSLTRQQLEGALEAKKPQQALDEYLKSAKIVSDKDLAKAFAQLFSLPLLAAIPEKMTDLELLAKVPLKFLREHVVIPLKDEDGRITLAIANPYKFQVVDELNALFGGDIQQTIASPEIIIEAINKYYPLEGTKEMIEKLEEEREFAEGVDLAVQEDILGTADEAPIIKLVNHILYQAVKREASDIHIEPFEKELRVRYRIDGVLHDVMMPPKRTQAAIISRIKIMANLNIAEKRQPQDGRIQIKIADKPIDIRVSVLPVTFGERVVMRLLDKTKTFGKLTQLGFSERDYQVIETSIHQPNGIMLITGPTGSGKTSTLYSILSELNKPDVNIVTVEDPVEYQMQGIAQVQVKEKIGLTFAAALRSILRQDPDIIMIGETRDQETAQIAIQSALTGHLVLSTLHTNSAAATITRLIDMGVEPFLISSTIISIMAQRLVRRLCNACKKAYQPTSEILKRIGLSATQAKTIAFYQAVGCEECLQTGYRGRLAVFEIMVMTPAISKLTIARADTNVIQEQARKDGMTLLLEDGIRKIAAGQTTIEEVLAVATSEESFQ